jgi:hypothetical protein
MTDFQVAVPIHDRREMTERAVLAYLDRSGIAAERVTLFVAPGMAHHYAGLPGRWQARVVHSELGLTNSRRWAEWNHYPEGTPLVWLNDDVFSLHRRVDAKRTDEVPLGEVAERGFGLCEKAGAFHWGVYAVLNPFYMKDAVRFDLRHLVGCSYGVITRREKRLYPQFGDSKEDYERCLRFYERDGRLVRMDGYAPDTIYYNPGSALYPTAERIEAAVRNIEDRWPAWVRRNPRRKGKYPEITIQDPAAKSLRILA